MRELNQELLTNPEYEEDVVKEEKTTDFMDNNYWKPITYEIDNDIDDLLKEDSKDKIYNMHNSVSLEAISVKMLQEKQEEIPNKPKYSRLLNKRKSSSNNISDDQYYDNSFWKVDVPSIESIDISGLLIDN